MKKDETSKFGQILKDVKERPEIYFSRDMSSFENFIAGFFLAARSTIDHDEVDSKYNELLTEAELRRNSSIIEQLKTKGFNEEEAIIKYLTILINSYGE